MLDDAYFATLDDAPWPGRLEILPIWARTYERDLKRLASWWSDHKRFKHHGGCPRVVEPKWERFDSLPQWAQDWLRTLRFEVCWQREQNGGETFRPPPTRADLFSRRRPHERSPR